LQGKPKYSEKTCPSAILSTTNPTLPDLSSNSSSRVGELTDNLLGYGISCASVYVELHKRGKKVDITSCLHWDSNSCPIGCTATVIFI
jgi:hypothetical protein